MKNKFLLLLKIFILLSLKTSFLHANNLKSEIIGYSLDKKAIGVYKFGNGKNIIILTSGIHGNEISVKINQSIIELFEQNKINIPLDKSVWIIPVLNPDGLFKSKKLNENNVDLNRNFQTDNWRKKIFFYNVLSNAGDEPFSEPETIALKNFFESIEKNSYPVILNIFEKENLIIPANFSNADTRLAKIINKNLNFRLSAFGNDISGNLSLWLSDKLGYPSVDILLKPNFEAGFNEVEKIINSLLTVNFKDEFYKYEIKNIKSKGSFEVNPEFFQYNLPEKSAKKILNSKENFDEFIKLYSLLENNEELLLLINKKYYLASDYKPEDLGVINGIFPTTKKSLMLRKIIFSDLGNMISAAHQDHANLSIVSGFRSYEEQKETFAYWEKINGMEEAKRISAAPGASQHQLGTAIDFNSLEFSFINTKEGIWLKDNAYKYGFVISFPEGMEELTGYKYEPWHYRYIGKEASLLVYKYFDNLLETFLNWYWDTRYNF